MKEIKTIEAYQCSCGVAYLDRTIAELCCKPKLCTNCNIEISKNSYYSVCRSCKQKADQLYWECAEKSSATEWLHSEVLGEYLQSEDFLENLYYKIDEEDRHKDMSLPIVEIARKYQIYLCNPYIPAHINLSEYYEEYCHEDCDLPEGWEEAEQAVNNWIDGVKDEDWPVMPSKIGWSGQK